jgi:hypothetical protein
MNRNRKRCRKYCAAAALTALYSACAWAAAPGPGDSAQAKEKLVAVRARIAALTGRLGDELKKRDALSARLRDAELVTRAAKWRVSSTRGPSAPALSRRLSLK